MRSGSLNCFVNVEQKYLSSTTGLRNKYEWAILYQDIPVSIVDLVGTEADLSRQVVASADVKITMRYHPGLTPEHRIKWGSNIYNIESIQNVDQKNRELILTCSIKKSGNDEIGGSG